MSADLPQQISCEGHSQISPCFLRLMLHPSLLGVSQCVSAVLYARATWKTGLKLVVRENPVRRSNHMDPGTRSSGPPLVSISRGLEQTPIVPGKPLVPVIGTHSPEAPVSERGLTTTTQPSGSRDATRSTQESPQVCRPMASAHRLPDRHPAYRSIPDARGRGCTSR